LGLASDRGSEGGLQASSICLSAVSGRLSLGIDAHHHRHTGRQTFCKRLSGIDSDPHGNTLRHLGEVAGRIVRSDHAEFGAGGRGELLDASGERGMVQGIDREGHGLADCQARQPRFLEVGDDLDSLRHDGEQLRSGGHVLAQPSAHLTKLPIFGGNDARVLQVDLGQPNGCLGALHGSLCLVRGWPLPGRATHGPGRLGSGL
jgi:hypothetical protein